jgi:hypothetical protein
MTFALNHDDGQSTWGLDDADVCLVGVSRTSKTPTCLYLANRGIKAANVPPFSAFRRSRRSCAPGTPATSSSTPRWTARGRSILLYVGG